MIWILSIVSSGCFYAGGRTWGRKLYRRLGCPLLAIIAIWLLKVCPFNLVCWTAFFALNFGAVGTYHDYLGKPGFLSNGEAYREENTACWLATGVAYGLAALPLLWLGVPWLNIIARTIALMALIPLIRKLRNADIEELLSGFFYLSTLLILK